MAVLVPRELRLFLRGALALGLLLLLVSPAQSQIASSATTVTEAIEKTLSEAITGFADATEGGNQTLAFLRPPVVLPDFFQEPETPLQELAFLAQPIHVQGSALVRSANDNYLAKLKAIAEKVEFGVPVLTAAQKTQLQESLALLQTASGEPTPLYATYNEFKREFAELIERQKAAITPAERAILQQELADLDDRWLIEGRRDQVDAAERVIANNSDIVVRREFASWKEALSSSRPIVANAIWQSFSQQSGWTTLPVVLGSGELGSSRLTTTEPAGDIATPSWASADISVFRATITNRVLDHPFIASRRWRTSDGSLISDGELDSSSATEVTSARIAEVYVVFGFEARYKDLTRWKQLAMALRGANNASLDGITLKRQGAGNFYIAPNYIRITRPVIFAISFVPLQKCPLPDDGLTWSN
jgi:hypothetical protein